MPGRRERSLKGGEFFACRDLSGVAGGEACLSTTAGGLTALGARVEATARGPGRVFYQARIYQVWGRRRVHGC